MTEFQGISQFSAGENSQLIGQMFGGTAIAKVENFVQHFHLSPRKVLTLGRFWNNWSKDTKPPFSPALTIGGREQERDSILRWLEESPNVFTLQGESQKEVSAFFAAVVQSMEEEDRTNVLNRAIVVNCETAWQNLIESSDPLILITELGEVEGIGQAIANGHHVFISSNRVNSGHTNLLPRILYSSAEQALKEMGFEHRQARRLATLARRSLSALRRKLAVAQNIQQPAWAKPNEARALLAPLLISTWSDSCKGDREALEQLSGLTYENIQPYLVRWANEPDAPIRKVGDIWMIAAQEDAWRLVARYFTNDDLQRFADVAVDVLSELDPKFELPPEQQFLAVIHKKVFSRSNWLRTGIAEMLALMATLSSDISFQANRTGEDVSRQIVWSLMEKAKDNPTLWTSLVDKLSLLAEAAPEIVLNAIEIGLSGEDPILVSLFQDRTSEAVSRCFSPHTGLLWALETLALNPDYLSRAALSLARLTRLDPGGKMSNRPVHSLKDIFVWWLYFHPNTNSFLPDCLQIINTIYKLEPNIAWNLSMSLLSYHGVTLGERNTRWRDWSTDVCKIITDEDYIRTTDLILKELISNVDKNISHWCNLIDLTKRVNINQKDTIMSALEVLKVQEFSVEERVQISDCLRHEIKDNRKYPDSQWSMSIENIQRLEAVLLQFEPNDLIYCYRHLFKYCVDLPDEDNISWQEKDRIVSDLRSKALQEILNLMGWDGALQLAQQVEEPMFVGVTLAESKLLPIDFDLFLRENFWSTDKWRSDLARGYVSFNACNQGEQWIDNCLNDRSQIWNTEERGEFLLCLPFNLYLLERLDVATVETQYYFWSRVKRIEFFGIDRTNQIIKKLLEFGRPHFAVTNISWVLEINSELFSPEQVAEVLESAIQNQPSQNYDGSSSAYNSSKLMSYLEKSDLSRDRLVNLELVYSQIHENHRIPRIIFERLSESPEFLVEILQYLYRNGSSPSVAKLIWHLLEKWKQLPGVSWDLRLNTVPLIWLLIRGINPIVGILLLHKFREEGTVNTETVRSWVFNVRNLAAECNLSEVADCYIGRALAFSLMDTDGAWPHKVVRGLIEELSNQTINSSWQCQIRNNRGFTCRSSLDGGKPEQVLAEKYGKYSEKIRNQWPQTAALLQEIANEYMREAHKEDINADLIQDFW